MELNELLAFKRFCRILHTCANYTELYAGDIFLDLPSMWEQYNNDSSDWPILLVRKDGADRIERFEDCLKERERPHEFKDCIEYAKQTLGVDFSVEITSDLVNITNYTLPDTEYRYLLNRFKSFQIGEVIDCDRP